MISAEFLILLLKNCGILGAEVVLQLEAAFDLYYQLF